MVTKNKIELDIIITSEKVGKLIVYSISAVQVPNVVTQGNTIEEAKKNLIEALKLYFEEVPEEKTLIIQEVKEEKIYPPMLSRIYL